MNYSFLDNKKENGPIKRPKSAKYSEEKSKMLQRELKTATVGLFPTFGTLKHLPLTWTQSWKCGNTFEQEQEDQYNRHDKDGGLKQWFRANRSSKSVKLQKRTPVMYLTLDEVVEVRKAKDAAVVAEKVFKAQEKADCERKQSQTWVEKEAAGRKLGPKSVEPALPFYLQQITERRWAPNSPSRLLEKSQAARLMWRTVNPWYKGPPTSNSLINETGGGPRDGEPHFWNITARFLPPW